MKISPNLYSKNGWVEILMFSLVSRKFLAMRNIALYSVHGCSAHFQADDQGQVPYDASKFSHGLAIVPACYRKL